MLCRFESRSFLTKSFFKYLKPCVLQFKSASISRKKLFIRKLDSYSEGKFLSRATNLQQGTEKIKKFIPHTITDYYTLPINSLHVDHQSGIIYLKFEKALDLGFPIVWLRDNCQCPQCFDPVSNSRIHSPLSFTSDIIPSSVTSTGESVLITWEDQHDSEFHKDWLCRHSFQAEHQAERLDKHNIQQIMWNAEDFKKILPKICFKFSDLVIDDKCLLNWMETLASVGITKIFDVPREIGQLVKLSQRVSFIRKTHYGEEYYIKGDSNANNVAYQKGPLPMHTDLPYYQYVPGVVLLHYIIQSSKGGENVIADGLNAVKQLSRESYDILATTLVDWLDIGFEKNNKFYSMYRAPVICKNYLENIERINWSQPQRNSVFNVSVEQATLWYRAYNEFSSVIHESKNAVHIKIEEGCILAFDNRRILHGRSDFSDKRFLCGAYLDWDEIYSRIRVLRHDFEATSQSYDSFVRK